MVDFHLDDLPPEIFLHVFFFLPAEYLFYYQRVCKRWKQIMYTEKSPKRLDRDILTSCLIVAAEQFPYELRKRSTYPSPINSVFFYIWTYKCYLLSEISFMERVTRSIEHQYEKYPLFRDVCVYFPHLMGHYLKVYKIHKYFEEIDTSDASFSIGRLNVHACRSRFDQDGQKLSLMIKVDERVLENEIEGLFEKTSKIEYIGRRVQEIWHEWLDIYARNPKKVPWFTYYNLKDVNILYTRNGFTRENYLRNWIKGLNRIPIYSLFVQGKIE
jgi:hypothetical protein